MTRRSKISVILCLLSIVGISTWLLKNSLYMTSRSLSTQTIRYYSDDDLATQLHTPIRDVQIIHRYPHRTSIFTQGLVWDETGQKLYESGGRYRHSTISQLNSDYQQVVLQRPLAADYFAEDITLFNNQLYLLTYQSQIGFILDKQTLKMLGTFPLMSEGWGITTDDLALILSDGSDHLTFKDPLTFKTIKTLTVHDAKGPVQRINALQYVEGKILANLWQTCFLAEISAADGTVLTYWDLRPLCIESQIRHPHAAELNGITWLPQQRHWLVTGKYWPILYEIIPINHRVSRE